MGYRRVHGELAALGVTVAPSTVWQNLKDAGTAPAPRRDGPGWTGFLRSRAQAIPALDFFTAGPLNATTVHVLAAISAVTAGPRVLAATGHPPQSWGQQARNLLMDLDDAGYRARFVLDELIAVRAIPKSDAWTVGYHDTKAYVAQTMIAHWNGASWRTVSSPGPAGSAMPTTFPPSRPCRRRTRGRPGIITTPPPPSRWSYTGTAGRGSG